MSNTIIDHMTLLEKASLLSGANIWQTRGIDRLGIPQRFLADGPHGLRKQLGAADHLGIAESQPATCFPTASALANSWDPVLAEEVGAAIGREAQSQSVHVVLGPGLNIKRSPLGGRNFEYYSEDPFLSGELASGAVRGIQSEGVAATPKHFAVNSQELRRMVSDSVVDERTLREIYLAGFERVVRSAEPWAIMTSYNLVNGVYANEHSDLLQRILRDEWGFDGLVVTDWGGGNDSVAGVRAGSTLEMPSPGCDSVNRIVAAVDSGDLDEGDIDARVAEVLQLIERTESHGCVVDLDAHHALARRAAAESLVLLKNDGALLPLETGASVAVIGDFAERPRFQGSGSSQVNATREVTPLEALRASGLRTVGYARGFRRDGVDDPSLRREAVDLARSSETVLLYLGLPELDESEGIDRRHLRLPLNQVALLRELAEVNDRIVVIVNAGAACESPWLGHTAALLHTYLAGQGAAEAVVDVLTGRINPSGRLAETFPVRLEDHPTAGNFPAEGRTAEYREGIFVGYRYFTSADVPVAFPFGFGLTYTEFEYLDAAIDDDTAVVTIRNAGAVAGSEVVQLYSGRPEHRGVHRPVRELRGFAKIHLEPGETGIVRLPLASASFRHWDTRKSEWAVEAGTYPLEIGASVEDIRLRLSITVEGSVPVADDPELAPYASADVMHVSDAAFTALLGHPIPSSDWGHGPLSANDPLGRMSEARSPLARGAAKILAARLRKADVRGEPDLNTLFLVNMPFRAIAKMAGGAVSDQMVAAILDVVNGRHVTGMGRLVSAYFTNLTAQRRMRRGLSSTNTRHAPTRSDAERAVTS